MDLAALADDDLAALIRDAYAEERRRATLQAAPVEAATLATQYLAARDGSDTAPGWQQPTGAHDAYPQGHVVTHGGKVWESLTPANVWEPGDPNDPQSYRWWAELSDDEGEPDPDNGPAGWSPNSHDYAAGDRVTYDGAEYECVQPHTSQPGWAPDAVPALWSKVH